MPKFYLGFRFRFFNSRLFSFYPRQFRKIKQLFLLSLIQLLLDICLPFQLTFWKYFIGGTRLDNNLTGHLSLFFYFWGLILISFCFSGQCCHLALVYCGYFFSKLSMNITLHEKYRSYLFSLSSVLRFWISATLREFSASSLSVFKIYFWVAHKSLYGI